MLILDPNTIGRGWTSVAFVDNPRHPDFGKTPYIRTLDQWYSPSELRWRTGSYFTADRFAYRGNIPYRRPVSFRAHVQAIFPGWFVKVWQHWADRLRKPPTE